MSFGDNIIQYYIRVGVKFFFNISLWVSRTAGYKNVQNTTLKSKPGGNCLTVAWAF